MLNLGFTRNQIIMMSQVIIAWKNCALDILAKADFSSGDGYSIGFEFENNGNSYRGTSCI